MLVVSSLEAWISIRIFGDGGPILPLSIAANVGTPIEWRSDPDQCAEQHDCVDEYEQADAEARHVTTESDDNGDACHQQGEEHFQQRLTSSHSHPHPAQSTCVTPVQLSTGRPELAALHRSDDRLRLADFLL